MYNTSCPQMYLVNKDNFWHCKCVQQKKKGSSYAIQQRQGKIDGSVIDLSTVEILSSMLVLDEKTALEFVSLKVQLLIEKGYHEVDYRTIRESAGHQLALIKHKISKKNRQMEKQIQLVEKQFPIMPQKKEELATDLDKFLGQKEKEPFKVLLAETWHEGIDPKGYMLSEKLDGMRALWRDGQLVSRSNKIINTPEYFTAGWPRQTLDGEIWIGRGQFQQLVSVARHQIPDQQEWKVVKYMVFDLPETQEPFKRRIQLIAQMIEMSCSSYLQLVQHGVCKGITHLQEELIQIELKGGEGIMLRNPDSFYENKRSKTLLKVKSFDDDDAIVIGYEDGIGRCSGSVGALKVRTRNNIYFSVGSGMTYDQRKNPPKLGATITYKYYGTTRDNKPRFPIFLKERKDIF